MKTFVLFVAAMLALSMAAVGSPIPDSGNKLVNGDFETGVATPWTIGNGLQLFDRTSTGDGHGWAVFCISHELDLNLRQVADVTAGGLWDPLAHSMIVDLTADINLTNLKGTLPLNSGIRFGLDWWDESFNSSNTPPTAPVSGNLWLDPIYFKDIPGYQAGSWVTVNPFNQDNTLFKNFQPRWVSVEIEFIQDPAEIVWVDNVILTSRCVPEPMSVMLGFLGLGSVGAFGRFRRK
ncbi:MAG: hypothetical protein M1133_06875 [Armatimonadetes bacterium]|nr:hypothetical protein [Armatimonadota bacterium]